MRLWTSPLLRFAVLAAVLTMGTRTAAAATDAYTIDNGHSSVNFKIKHLGVSYSYGRFNTFSGSFTIDDKDTSKCSVNISIDSASVDTNDKKRDEHLRKPDFFNCAKHPKITFASTKVEKTKEGYRVTGNFTLLGVSKSVVIRMKKIGEGKDPWGNYRMGFDGGVVIRRSEFGMKAMIPMIGDEVDITLGIEGIKK